MHGAGRHYMPTTMACKNLQGRDWTPSSGLAPGLNVPHSTDSQGLDSGHWRRVSCRRDTTNGQPAPLPRPDASCRESKQSVGQGLPSCAGGRDHARRLAGGGRAAPCGRSFAAERAAVHSVLGARRRRNEIPQSAGPATLARRKSVQVPDRLFRQMAATESPQGIAALVELQPANLRLDRAARCLGDHCLRPSGPGKSRDDGAQRTGAGRDGAHHARRHRQPVQPQGRARLGGRGFSSAGFHG